MRAVTEEGSAVPLWLRDLGAAVAMGEAPAPLTPPPTGGRQAAVLVLFAVGAEGPDLLLIQRGTGLRLHPGEAAFPGGAIDTTDGGPAQAALRETTEEVGIAAQEVEVVAMLPEMFIPPTRFRVVPVLGWWRRPRSIQPVSRLEVEAAERVSIREFADPAGRLLLHRPPGIVLPAFRVRVGLVWGITAAVIDQLLRAGGWERDWDSRVTEVDMPVGE